MLDNPSDPYVEQYLAIVRNLLTRALDHHRAQSSPYWSPKGQFRQMVYVTQVNQALQDLVADIRTGQIGTEMARRLDTIRGLLVDLWI